MRTWTYGREEAVCCFALGVKWESRMCCENVTIWCREPRFCVTRDSSLLPTEQIVQLELLHLGCSGFIRTASGAEEPSNVAMPCASEQRGMCFRSFNLTPSLTICHNQVQVTMETSFLSVTDTDIDNQCFWTFHADVVYERRP